jgi:hypothetical protein
MMGISVHIEDVTRETPEALWRTGVFLMDMAVEGGYVVDDETPTVSGDEPPMVVEALTPSRHLDAAPAPDLTAVFGAVEPALGVNRPAAVPPAPPIAAPVPVDAQVSTIHVYAGEPPTSPNDAPPGPEVMTVHMPAAPVPVPPGDRRGHDLDARGFPWDARIHGRTKAKIGDGTWRYRRGSTDEEIAVVEAELRQTMGAGHGSPEPDADAAKLEALAGSGSSGPTLAEVGMVPPPPAPVAPVAPVAPATEDFGAFMHFVISSVASGKIQQPQVIAIVNEFGLPHVGAVFQRQDLIPQIRAKIEALLA